MDKDAFDRMKVEIMRRFQPSGGDNLSGMEMDFNAYLYGLEVLDDAQARRTSDPERLVVATARAKPGATADAVVTALEEVWTSKLQYNYRAGHRIVREQESVQLLAVTQIAPDGFYVTAEVTVSLHE